MARWILTTLLFCAIWQTDLTAAPPSQTLNLKTQFVKTTPGDYLVASRDEMITLLLIRENQNEKLVLEEICAPEKRVSKGAGGWKEWVQQGAPGRTAWVQYVIDIPTGQMEQRYSYLHQSHMNVDSENNLLSTLLKLQFNKIPERQRRKIGSRTKQNFDNKTPYWQPRMVFEGKKIAGVEFNAFRTKWPSDQTDLSGKWIEIYLPKDSSNYPAYFPYWLEVSGIIGKAELRIIDSGKGMKSPQTPLPLASLH